MGEVLPSWATTLLGSLIGVAVAWGTLRAHVGAVREELIGLRQAFPRLLEGLASLKASASGLISEVDRLKDQVHDLSAKVAVLDAFRKDKD